MKVSCSKKERIILHVDMDHFFSAVEARGHPRFKGRAVVAGADPKGGEGRGVVKTCNYEAREFGIHSGTGEPLWSITRRAVNCSLS